MSTTNKFNYQGGERETGTGSILQWGSKKTNIETGSSQNSTEKELQEIRDQIIHLQQYINTVGTSSKKLEKDINQKIKKSEKGFNEKIDNSTTIFGDKIEASTNKQLQVLGLFIGLFTFISIQFQIFSNVSKSTVISLSLIFISTIGLFLTYFLYVLDSKERGDSTHKILFGGSLTVLAIGIIFFVVQMDDGVGRCSEIKQSINQKKVLLKDNDGKSIVNNLELICD